MKITVCGVYCDKECYAFGKECAGCNTLQGKVSWTRYLGKEVCPIYQCVIDKGYSNCGDCSELPCNIWLIETKNPERTDAEYKQEIALRIKNLKNLHNSTSNPKP